MPFSKPSALRVVMTCMELVRIPDKIFLSPLLVGFSPMHPFIGFAEGADILLDVLYKIKDHSLLVMPGVEADRAEFAYLCQGSVQSGRFRAVHKLFSSPH